MQRLFDARNTGPITSVAKSFQSIGERAAESLIARIEGHSVERATNAFSDLASNLPLLV